MRPICLAVIFDQRIQVGGGYQQALNAAILTQSISPELAKPIFFTTLEENVATLATYNIAAIYIPISLIAKFCMAIRRRMWDPRLLKWAKKISTFNAFEKVLVENNIDLVYFLTPDGRARDLERLNYIATIWDLCHRDDPEFPESRWDHHQEVRDRNCKEILPKATAILADSELGRTNLIHRYGLDAERIHVMPFEAAISTQSNCSEANAINIDIREKYNLDVPYIFYPAQFWAHKNHIYLLEGLADLQKRHGITIGAIFTGADKGNLDYVKRYAAAISMDKNIRFGGFVSNEEIAPLYKQSLALVMPTYFGPTNLPPLEAFQLGVPVLYSNKAGLREQVGDAALLMDLKRPSSMADHLAALFSNVQLRAALVEKGKSQLRRYDREDRVRVLECIVEDFRWRRMCWE